MVKETYILGVKVNLVDFQSSLEIAKELLDQDGKHYIVTPNPEIIVGAQKDKELLRILNNSSLSIPDGIGVVLLSRLYGEPIKERVTGVDLLEGLAALSSEHGYSLFLLGAKEGIASKAAERLLTRYPNLKVAGTFSGDGGESGDEEILNVLSGKRIDILAVAFGFPKQEKWIARNLPKIDVKLAIGVGGALDYISGEVPRAPKWMQKSGLEWFYRLMKQPSRIIRQIALPKFILLAVRDLIFRKLR